MTARELLNAGNALVREYAGAALLPENRVGAFNLYAPRFRDLSRQLAEFRSAGPAVTPGEERELAALLALSQDIGDQSVRHLDSLYTKVTEYLRLLGAASPTVQTARGGGWMKPLLIVAGIGAALFMAGSFFKR